MDNIKIRKMVFSIAMTLAVSVSGHVTPAHATIFCYVKETSDGFVALRKKPSPQGKMIGRMKAGDEVMLGDRKKGSSWYEVTWWHGDDRLAKGFDKKSGFGWVNRKFIDAECG